MSETDGSATPRPILTDPDEAFARWHYLEFGFEPGKYPTPVENLRSCWEHARQFERQRIAEKNREAIRATREEIKRTQSEILKEVGRERKDTGRGD